MKTVTIKSYITKGINAVPVDVAVSVTDGIGIHLVGLQDASVKEVLLRTTTALVSLGYKVPGRKIVIDIKSSDGLPVTCCASNLDLPVAVGILVASGQWEESANLDIAVVGELGLDGTVREVRSEYTIALAADKVILPKDNAARLADLPGILDEHKVSVVNDVNEALYALNTPDAFDIKMRMLRIDELLLIMGFPADYKLLGTQSENKKYIGNAVECGMARQLCESIFQRLNA